MPSLRRRALLLAALATCPVRSGLAQVADSSNRDQVRPLPALTALPQLHRLFAYEPATPLRVGPEGWRHGDVRVTLLTSRSIAGSEWNRSIGARVWACAGGREAKDPGNAAQRSGVKFGTAGEIPRPWAAVDAASHDRAFIGLQIDSPVRPPSSCSVATAPAVLRAGVQMIEPGAPTVAFRYFQSVAVGYHETPLTPTASAQAPATVLVPDGTFLHTPPVSVRLYFPVQAFDPDRRGRFDGRVLSVAVADEVEPNPIILELSDSLIRGAWRDFLPWRLDGLSGPPRTHDLPRLPMPEDTIYRRALAAYAGGDPATGAGTALAERERLAAKGTTDGDRRFADLLIGSTLLAYGDSLAGREEYADALTASPCLRLQGHPAFDHVLDAARPTNVRCTWVPAGKEVAWGLGFPGGAQWVHGDRESAGAVAFITGGLFATALAFHLQAARQYLRYRNATGKVDALLDQANTTQREARTALVAAGAAWLAGTVVGMVTEAVHQRDVQAQQQYEPAAAGGRR